VNDESGSDESDENAKDDVEYGDDRGRNEEDREIENEEDGVIESEEDEEIGEDRDRAGTGIGQGEGDGTGKKSESDSDELEYGDEIVYEEEIEDGVANREGREVGIENVENRERIEREGNQNMETDAVHEDTASNLGNRVSQDGGNVSAVHDIAATCSNTAARDNIGVSYTKPQILVDSTWSPNKLQVQSKESTGSAQGLHQESTWTPGGPLSRWQPKWTAKESHQSPGILPLCSWWSPQGGKLNKDSWFSPANTTHGVLQVVNCTGNPRVFFSIPIPVSEKNPYPHHGYGFSCRSAFSVPQIYPYPYPWRVTRRFYSYYPTNTNNTTTNNK